MWKRCLFRSAPALLTVALAACTGAESDSSDAASPAGEDAASAEDRASLEETAELTPPVEEAPAEEDTRYDTLHDPDRVYTLDDLTMKGSYLKINFSGLSPGQMNKAVHRLMTEFCTCGCPEDTIDECLINDPACGTAVQLANQIVREEKAKGS